MVEQRLGRCKGEPAARPDPGSQVLEVDSDLLVQADQKKRFLIVAQKQILGVSPGDLAAKMARLLDGEDRGVLSRVRLDAQLVEESEKLVGCLRHEKIVSVCGAAILESCRESIRGVA